MSGDDSQPVAIEGVICQQQSNADCQETQQDKLASRKEDHVQILVYPAATEYQTLPGNALPASRLPPSSHYLLPLLVQSLNHFQIGFCFRSRSLDALVEESSGRFGHCQFQKQRTKKERKKSSNEFAQS